MYIFDVILVGKSSLVAKCLNIWEGTPIRKFKLFDDGLNVTMASKNVAVINGIFEFIIC